MDQKMLNIKLDGKGTSSEAGPSPKPVSSEENVRATCPAHLVLSDLEVARRIGSVPAAPRVKIVGRVAEAGEKSHFCIHCNFPIAVYGRLSPCEHAFCLDCAKSARYCFICQTPTEKIQSIKLGEGMFICGMRYCLKSFREKTAFQDHINDVHAAAGHRPNPSPST